MDKIIFLILIALFIPPVLGISYAKIRDGACLPSETCFASIYKENNAHIARCEYYNYSICLQNLLPDRTTITLRNGNCETGENFLLGQYQPDNSHISINENYYNYSLCSSDFRIEPSCSIDAAIKIFSHYKEDNSHVGSLDYYSFTYCIENLKFGKVPDAGGGSIIKEEEPEEVLDVVIETIKKKWKWTVTGIIILIIILFVVAYFCFDEVEQFFKKSVDCCLDFIVIFFMKKEKKKKKPIKHFRG